MYAACPRSTDASRYCFRCTSCSRQRSHDNASQCRFHTMCCTRHIRPSSSSSWVAHEQFWLSWLDPLHEPQVPPPQLRLRVWVPDPQDTLHEDQPPQLDQELAVILHERDSLLEPLHDPQSPLHDRVLVSVPLPPHGALQLDHPLQLVHDFCVPQERDSLLLPLHSSLQVLIQVRERD